MRIAILGVGACSEFVKAAIEAARQAEEIRIVSMNDINIDPGTLTNMENELKNIDFTNKIYSVEALPTLDIPLPEKKNNKPFYYNIPKSKRGRR